MDGDKLMKIAIEEAYAGINSGVGGPFGAVVAGGDGRILGRAHNSVLKDNDPTRHAEIKAISEASKALGTYDLSGCVIYTTTEPCPMCFSAIHWARIEKIFFGTNIEDVKKLGFNELSIPAEKMKKIGSSGVLIEGGFMRGECLELLRYWDGLPDKKTY